MRQIALPQPFLETLPARRPRLARTIGIIGGGQLAKMLAQAAAQFGCEVVILERNHNSPASHLATQTVIGDWDNPESLLALGALADVVTLENEFVDADSLAALENFGHTLWPGSKTIRLVQDKFIQKQALAKAGLPVPAFAAVASQEEVLQQAKHLGWPLLLKKRRNGYDGKGNFTARGAEDVATGWTLLKGDQEPLMVEQFCPFVKELAIMITRGQRGELATYPVVETVQRDHICHLVTAPAGIAPELAATVEKIARAAVETSGHVGTMGVELFLKADGQVVINELAPRVHNSGHYTIEASVCSQFENHIRAVLDWPLGSTAMRPPAAAMVNLLGAGTGLGAPKGLTEALQIAGAHPHIYGKAVSAPGRKMGHVTALGNSLAEATGIAQKAADQIRFGEPK